MTRIKHFKIALGNCTYNKLYPLKCDMAVFDAAHSSVFVNIAGFDKLVERSFCLVII